MKAKTALLFVLAAAAAKTALSQDLEINNAADFVNFANNVNNGDSHEKKTIVLNADIDLSAYTIDPIGNNIYGFRGYFDGRGHKISGLNITTGKDRAGLFGTMYWYGSVRNLVLDDTCAIISNFAVDNSNCYMGGFVGTFHSSKDDYHIENCVNMANLVFKGSTGSGDYSLLRMGGIIGSASPKEYSCYIRNCVNKGSVVNEGSSGDVYIGGVVGYFGLESSSNEAFVKDCESYGLIKNSGSTSVLRIGGVVGNGYGKVVIDRCKNYGNILSEKAATSSDVFLGGVVGAGVTEKSLGPITVRNCENYGELTDSTDTQTSEFGGIVGQCQSFNSSNLCHVYNCVNRGNLTHNGFVSSELIIGGVVGFSCNYGSIENCLNLGTIREEGNKASRGYINFMGGITGLGFVTIAKNCANYGRIEFEGNTETLEVGNIFGRCEGMNGECNTANCLGTGTVYQRGTPTDFWYGGVMGFSWANNKIDNCVASSSLDSANVNIIGGAIGFSVISIVTNCYWKDSLANNAIDYKDSSDNSTTNNSYSYSFTSGSTTSITTSNNTVLIDVLNNRCSAATGLGYAGWAQNAGESAVKFVVNGEEFVSTNNHVVLIPSFVTSSDDARSAAFGGWFTDSLMSNPAGTVTSFAADTTLYGAFGTLRAITFVYGSSTANSTQAEGEALVLPTYASKAGYTFKWCTEDESVCKTSGDTVPAQDITLKATLVPNEYTATFKNGYDESETTTKAIKCGDEINYPTFTREGYSFSGWMADVTVTDNKMPASNAVFTAQWTINKYKVSFVSDGVTVDESTLEYGADITFPSEPVKEGYNFSGWSPDVAVTDNKMPASNVTFTANWTEATTDGATNVVRIVIKTTGATKDDIVKEIKDSIAAEEGTYEIKEISTDESEKAIFIVVFKDVEDAKEFTRTILKNPNINAEYVIADDYVSNILDFAFRLTATTALTLFQALFLFMSF